MSETFGTKNIIINRLLGRTYHNPLGRRAFYSAAKRAHIGPKSRVLDVGTGRGFGAVYLANEFGCNVTGIDISKAMLSEARHLKANLRRGKARFIYSSLKEHHTARPFDLICCFDVLGFVPDKRDSIAHLAGLLKNNGVMVTSDYFYKKKTPAVLKLVRAWGLRSLGSHDSLKRDIAAAGLKLLRYEDTTSLYMKHWQMIAERLERKWNAICEVVGDEAVVRYKKSIRTILTATRSGDFGHVTITARKK